MSRIREDAGLTRRALRYPSALLSLVLLGLVVLGAVADAYALAGAVLVAQLVLATTPAPRGADGRPLRSDRWSPILVGALVATALTVRPQLLEGASGTTSGSVGDIDTGVLSGIELGAAVVVVLTMLAQMRRKDGRVELMTSLTDTVSLGVVATLLTGWIAARPAVDGRAEIALCAIGVGVTTIVWTVSAHGWAPWLGAVVVSAGVVGLASHWIGASIGLGSAAGIGGLVALLASVGCAGAHRWRLVASQRWAVEAVLPLALAAPAVFVASQLYGT